MIQDIGNHRLFNQFRPDAVPRADSYVFLFRGRDLAVKICGDHFSVPFYRDFPENTAVRYLFTLDETDCFLTGFSKEESASPDNFSYLPIRSLRKQH